MRRFVITCFAVIASAACLQAQSFTTAPCSGPEGNTDNHWSSFGRQERACELRRTTLPLVNGQLSVSGKNGGIELIGEDRPDIALEARVTAQASSRDEAESIVREIKIDTNGALHATGPQDSGWSHRNWSVNYRLHVPRHLTANLHTENGGIDISGVEGAIHAETTNGGLSLSHLAGDVHATTVNGGLDVALAGNQWQGSGLFAKSTNGGVSVKAPNGYSAHLIAETVNGGISVGLPMKAQGTFRRHLETDLGQGGPTLQFQTVNGGVSIDRN